MKWTETAEKRLVLMIRFDFSLKTIAKALKTDIATVQDRLMGNK